MSFDRGLLIGGHWEPGTSQEAVTEAATGVPVGHTAVANPADVARAVEAARRAQPAWAALAPGERRDILTRAATLIEERVDQISRTLTLEQGKPLADSRKEVLFSAEVLRYYGEEGMRLHSDLRRSARLPDVRSLVEWRPQGVVGAIVPWNYPVDLWSWKVGGALAAGNAVVAKPPLETPLAVGMAAQCLIDAGLPAGVLNDLPGGADVGSALVTIDGVDMVSATASVETGRAIAAAAAKRLTPLLLELGGHSPFVVLDDADIETAAAAAARRCFSNTGQICIAVNRVLVAERIADAFTEAVAAVTDRIVVGDPLHPSTTMGPATVRQVVERTRAHLEDATSRGARLVRGGESEGAFVQPIVVDHVPIEARVMNEETYGPILPIHRVASDAEALAVSNSLDVGLAAYVFGSDLERLWHFAEQLEFGMVGVNINDTTELGAPFGGWKLSGFGAELGPEGLRNYARLRHIRMKLW